MHHEFTNLVDLVLHPTVFLGAEILEVQKASPFGSSH